MQDLLRTFILNNLSKFHLRPWHETDADGYTYIHKSLTLEIYYHEGKSFLDFVYMPHDCDLRTIVSLSCDNKTSDTITTPYMANLEEHLRNFRTELKNII
jgi:hypothetical protein